MSNNFDFGNRFSNYICSALPGTKIVSGGKELVTRCKYCADSEDPNHGHMYIKIPQDNRDPILFHCFKCQTSGIVDSSTLLEWGIYDPNIATESDRINKQASNIKFDTRKNIRYNLYNTILNQDLAKIKLDYINQRIGTHLTFSDCVKSKIVLNLSDIISSNNFEITRHPNIVNQLNQYFVGFLSLDGNFINFRRICDEGIVYSGIDKRYINYNLHNKVDNTEKMYILPTTIDLTIPTRIQLHIAEGPFDILSIRYNLRGESSNSIFAAITGSGYKGLIRHIITEFKIFFFDIHLYPDNDKHGSSDMINDVIRMLSPYNCHVYEHRNNFPGEKDFGVPISRIDEKIYQIY